MTYHFYDLGPKYRPNEDRLCEPFLSSISRNGIKMHEIVRGLTVKQPNFSRPGKNGSFAKEILREP
jgi:hypothetical protein